MSAVQGLRSRPGFGQRMLRAAGSAIEALRPGAAGALPRDAGLAAGKSRTESLLRRHVSSHGRVGAVLEIGAGETHAGWFGEGVRHACLSVCAGGSAADVVSALRSTPTGSLDLVYSVDALELVKAPWRLAEEIQRVLKPGGLTFHATVFTTRYQPQPEDYFRFTPDGLRCLFDGLDCLTAEFDATERQGARSRRACADIFGGSREGWRVHYCGRKPLAR